MPPVDREIGLLAPALWGLAQARRSRTLGHSRTRAMRGGQTGAEEGGRARLPLLGEAALMTSGMAMPPPQSA